VFIVYRGEVGVGGSKFSNFGQFLIYAAPSRSG